jgi:FO synthase subunit 2
MTTIQSILNKVTESDNRLSADDAAKLFDCTDKGDIQLIKSHADKLRSNIAGDKVSYISNLNVNFTNICESVCLFCGFRRSENDPDATILNLDEFEETLYIAANQGITEICLQGGLFSKLKIKGLKSNNSLDMYAELLQWIKSRYSHIHLHAYSPEEIDFLSILSGKSINYVLSYLKDSGLGSMPGTAAEIFDKEIRSIICPKKISADKWVNIIKTAHKTGIPSTATIMYGHIESSLHRAKHLEVLRNLQEETGGLTEFVPLPFVANKTHLSGKIVPLKSVDRLKLLAISRLFFKDLIPNIQASWVKQGIEETAESLDWGVNDIGGTLGDERITFEAGGNYGRSMTEDQLVSIINSKNRTPVLRDTLYNYIKEPILK